MPTTRVSSSRSMPGAQLLDPAVLARIGGLDLIARTVVDGFVGGLHRAPVFGATTDFAEHRIYLPGDDPRRIDWRLFGRTDRLHVKEFEADTNTSVTVLLDVSKSMSFASPGRVSKLDYARFLAASLLWLAHRQRDRVGLATFDAAVRDFVPPSSKHLPLVLQALDRTRPGGAGELTAPLASLSEHFRRRGIIVVISDLYAEPSAVMDAMLRLRNRGNELLLMHVLDPAEVDFPFLDATSLQDLESGELVPIVPAKFRAEYRSLVAAHLESLASLAAKRGVDYARFVSSMPLDAALFRYLTGRERFESLARGR
jgi:uncharacterized protein (DUF58 family)